MQLISLKKLDQKIKENKSMLRKFIFYLLFYFSFLVFIFGNHVNQLYVSNQLLIKFKFGISQTEMNKVVESLSGIVKKRFYGDSYLILAEFESNLDLVKKILNTKTEVIYTDRNYIISTYRTPNDPLFPQQWGMRQIESTRAWDREIGSRNIIIANIDTGVELNHEDLSFNIWKNPGEICEDGIDNDGNGYIDDCNGWNFFDNNNNVNDTHGHGTETGGVSSAQGDNGIGITGTTWQGNIMVLKFLNGGTGTIEGAIEAWDYASMMRAHISNNSWGCVPTFFCDSQSLLEAAQRSSHLIVGAAGNWRTNINGNPYSPLPHVIAVAASNAQDDLSSFSNYGNQSVHVAAPGENILTTSKDNSYIIREGTSLAAPHVSGLAALLLSRNLNLSNADLKRIIIDTSDRNSFLEGRIIGGRINAYQAVIQAERE
jgi:subtilisin family serine protease